MKMYVMRYLLLDLIKAGSIAYMLLQVLSLQRRKRGVLYVTTMLCVALNGAAVTYGPYFYGKNIPGSIFLAVLAYGYTIVWICFLTKWTQTELLKVSLALAIGEGVFQTASLLAFWLETLINGYSKETVLQMPWNLVVVTVLIEIAVLAGVLDVVAQKWYPKCYGKMAQYPILLWTAVGICAVLKMLTDHGRMEPRQTPINIFVGLLLAIAAVFALLLQIAKNRQLAREYYNLSLRLVLMKEYASKLQSQADRLRKFRHDMANHMQIIQDLSGKAYEEEIRRYSGVMQVGHGAVEQETYCQNIFLDTLLCHKKERAEMEKIVIQMEVADIPEECIDSTDLVILVSNLLDNAIEACSRMEKGKERKIQFCCQCETEQMTIICENTMDENSLLHSGMNTVKKHAEEHGMGTRIIRDVVKKYQGIVRSDRTNGWNRVWIRMGRRTRGERR